MMPSMILGDPHDRRPCRGTTLDDLFRRAAQRAARRPRARRPAEPRELHRRRAAPPHLCRGRPRRLGDRGAAAPTRPADRRDRRHPASEHRRERADPARRAARRHDRGAAAAAVAARRCRGRARPARRQGDRHRVADRRLRPLRDRRCRSRPRSFRSATSAASAEICRTAWWRSTTCCIRRRSMPPPDVEREGNPAAHVAVVTFDVDAGRHRAGRAQPCRADRRRARRAARRRHRAGRQHPRLRAPPARSRASRSPCAVAAQRRHAVAASRLRSRRVRRAMPRRCAATPSSCRARCCRELAEAGLLGHAELKTCSRVWRAPERLAAQPAVAASERQAHRHAGVRRDRAGRLARAMPTAGRRRCRPSAIVAPRGSASAVPVAEIARTGAGTLALRGPMVPRHAFPPGAERGRAPHLKPDATGFVDTCYPCRLDRMTGTMTITGPPPGIVSVGGYRFVLSELDETGPARRRRRRRRPRCPTPRRAPPRRHLRRWRRARRARPGLGVNPLLADAFRDRTRQAASSR